MLNSYHDDSNKESSTQEIFESSHVSTSPKTHLAETLPHHKHVTFGSSQVSQALFNKDNEVGLP